MLIVAARKLLRSRPRLELNRKELAIEAGLTPAMIHYYFRDHLALIEEAARPVIDGYIERLKSVLERRETVEVRFRSIIILLIEIARKDGFLLDAYIPHFKRRRGDKSDILFQAYFNIAAFLSECSEARYIRVSDLAFTVTLLWGACKVIAQTPELQFDAAGKTLCSFDIDQRQADLIIDVFIRGLGFQAARA